MISLKNLLAACLCLLGISLQARETKVSNPSELEKAINSANAGDVLIMEKGFWQDANILINKGGNASRPLTIRAEVPGETILCGASRIEIKAPFVTIDGLFFKDGAIEKGSVVEFGSNHGVLQNTAILNYNPPDFKTDYYWVFFSGNNNLVDRCYFNGKSNMHPLIGNAVDGSRHNSVTNSCFKNIPFNVGNGREIIRVWGYGKYDELGTDGAFFTVEGNLFDHADGEGTETISLKSNRNIVQRNTVIASRGGITIRRGAYNTVKNNIVLGQGLDGADGLRISGPWNLVEGNFVSGCEFGFRLTAGEYVKESLTKSYQPCLSEAETKGPPLRTTFYPRVSKLSLLNNTVLGSRGADLEVGFIYKKNWPESQMVLLPENCLIKGNRFIRSDGGDSIIGEKPDPTPPFNRFSSKPNQYLGNVLLGGKCNFQPAANGFKSQPLPAGWNEAEESKSIIPLTLSDVGPAWVIALREADSFPSEEPSPVDQPLDGRAKKKKDKKNKKS